MKKIILIFLLIDFCLIAAYALFNQFDLANIKHPYIGKTTADIFGEPDYSRTNGYYRLLSLDEAENVDAESDEIYHKYRQVHDPALYDKAGRKNIKKDKYHFQTKWRAFVDKHKKWKWMVPMKPNGAHWCKKVIENRELLTELEEILTVFMNRYRRFIYSSKIEDITNFNLYFTEDKGQYMGLPNYTTWLNLAKIYNALAIKDAMEGNWEQAISSLISHLNALRKFLKNNRNFAGVQFPTGIMKLTIASINTVLNHMNCPDTAFKAIADLPELTHGEYGLRQFIISEMALNARFYLEYYIPENLDLFESLFYQKKRTKQLYFDHIDKLLAFDQKAPYQWQVGDKLQFNPKQSAFWWIQNPIGKHLLSKMNLNLKVFFLKANELKARFDLMQIAAELRLNYTGKEKPHAVLLRLKTFKKLKDPFSGKPYRWNEKNKWLYSIGPDRKDDLGKYDFIELMDTDFSTSVVLYVR